MRYDFSLFGPRLRQACERQSMTIHDLGRSIGLAPRRIMELEQRGTRIIDIERLAQIADYLDVSMDWLCGAPE